MTDLKLNVGCGDWYVDHSAWVNLDISDAHPVDVLASADALPFPSKSTSKVYAGHVLEHLMEDDALRAICEFGRVLKPGGMLMAVGPDWDRALEGVRERRFSPDTLEGVVYGAQRWDGDDHKWLCRESTMYGMLDEAYPWDMLTPVPIHAAPDGWPIVSRVGWQCCLVASKSHSPEHTLVRT